MDERRELLGPGHLGELCGREDGEEQRQVVERRRDDHHLLTRARQTRRIEVRAEVGGALIARAVQPGGVRVERWAALLGAGRAARRRPGRLLARLWISAQLGQERGIRGGEDGVEQMTIDLGGAVL